MTQQNKIRKSPYRNGLRDWLNTHDPDRLLLLSGKRTNGENLLQMDSGQGWLSQQLPKSAFAGPNRFEGCVFWFPRGLPRGNSIHLASSRIGKQPEQKASIFAALRTLATRTAHDHCFLISHHGTTLHEYVSRLQSLFETPVLQFEPMPAGVNSDWFGQTLNSANANICYYQALEQNQVAADHLLIQSATEVRVLAARQRGNIAQQTLKRLNNGKFENAENVKTIVLVEPRLTLPRIHLRFRNAGAIDWWLYSSTETNDSKRCFNQTIYALNELHQQFEANDFMIHWTRHRSGPWPNQTQTEFLDDLILGLDSNDHSRIASLRRIVASKKLLADAPLCRDKTPVVCFADVAVDEVLQRRIFRSHVGRWDFEPCGIAIRKSVLAELGAKPVIYGDDDTWANLSRANRPFFQIAVSNSGKNEIDWTQEREHRICGNVSLEQIASDDAFLFVENRREAEQVAPLSRWPVVILTNESLPRE